MLLSAGQRPISTPSAPITFAALFYEYRHRDADRAVEILSTWNERQIDRDVKLPPDENDAWAKAALALLLVEARRGIPTSAAKAESLIVDAYDRARATGDRRLLTFCRDWYFVGLTSHANLSMDVEAELRRRFDDDPLAQLELGKKAERFLAETRRSRRGRGTTRTGRRSSRASRIPAGSTAIAYDRYR